MKDQEKRKAPRLGRWQRATVAALTSTVAEEKNEVAGRIRWLAAFSRPSAWAAALALAAVAAAAAFCLGGQSPAASAAPAAQADGTLVWQADLTHDGTAEEIRFAAQALRDAAAPLEVYDAAGALLWAGDETQMLSTAHVGWMGYYLYQKEEGAYLLQYSRNIGTGSGWYAYRLFWLDADGGVQTAAENELGFTTGMPAYETNNVEAVLAFQAELQALLDDAPLLVTTDQTDGFAHFTAADGTAADASAGLAAGWLAGTLETPLYLTEAMDWVDAVLTDDYRVDGGLREKLEAFNRQQQDGWAEIEQQEQAETVSAPAAAPSPADSAAGQTAFAGEWAQESGELTLTIDGARAVTVQLFAGADGETAAPLRQAVTGYTEWNGAVWRDKTVYDPADPQDWADILALADGQPLAQGAPLTIAATSFAAEKRITQLSCAAYAADGTPLWAQSRQADGEGGAQSLSVLLDLAGQQEIVLRFTLLLEDGDDANGVEDRVELLTACRAA